MKGTNVHQNIKLHPDKVAYRKSTYSNGTIGCVEVADLGHSVRDSKDPDGPALHFTDQELEALGLGIVSGEFAWFRPFSWRVMRKIIGAWLRRRRSARP